MRVIWDSVWLWVVGVFGSRKVVENCGFCGLDEVDCGRERENFCIES